MGQPDESQNELEVVDAELVEDGVPETSGNTGSELVITHPQQSQQVTELARTLEEHNVPAGIRQAFIALAQHGVETESRVALLEEQLRGLADRNRALAAILLGGALPQEQGRGVEKAPNKLRPLEIATPEQAELINEGFSITLTNPNQEAVEAEVRIVPQNFDGQEDPVLEAVVNPKGNKAGVLVPRPIILGPNESSQIAVTLRSKQDKDANPKATEIIAEQIQIAVTLKPKDVDSALPARAFTPIKKDIRFNEALVHEAEMDLAAEAYSGENPSINFDINIKNIEWLPIGERFSSRHSFKDHLAIRTDIERTKLGSTFQWQVPFTGYASPPQARTKQGRIPIDLGKAIVTITVHLAKEIRKRTW